MSEFFSYRINEMFTLGSTYDVPGNMKKCKEYLVDLFTKRVDKSISAILKYEGTEWISEESGTSYINFSFPGENNKLGLRIKIASGTISYGGSITIYLELYNLETKVATTGSLGFYSMLPATYNINTYIKDGVEYKEYIINFNWQFDFYTSEDLLVMRQFTSYNGDGSGTIIINKIKDSDKYAIWGWPTNINVYLTDDAVGTIGSTIATAISYSGENKILIERLPIIFNGYTIGVFSKLVRGFNNYLGTNISLGASKSSYNSVIKANSKTYRQLFGFIWIED